MAGKTKVRLNIVDFLLIALLILSVVAIFLRPMMVEQIGRMSANDTVIVSFVAEDVTAEQLERLNEGDLLSYNGAHFGELTAFTTMPSEKMQLIEPEGSAEQAYFQKVTRQGSQTVKGQLKLTGSDRENGFYVGGNTYVGVGTVLYLRADSYVLTVQITGIS